jgi:hypothetical protein
MLRPQDIVVLLKLHLLDGQSWTFERVASGLFMSASQVYQALVRAEEAGLYFAGARTIRPYALAEFLEHGVRYAFATRPGSETTGVPTSHSAAPLKDCIVSGQRIAYVWPCEKGDTAGLAITPLHRSVPLAAIADPAFHQLMSLVDALRLGRIRERQIASQKLRESLGV